MRKMQNTFLLIHYTKKETIGEMNKTEKYESQGAISNTFFISGLVGRPVFNAIGGSITGVAILILIIMVIWYLKRVEKEKKAKSVSFLFSTFITIILRKRN